MTGITPSEPAPEVINLEGSPEGGTSSPRPFAEPSLATNMQLPMIDVTTSSRPQDLGPTSRGPGPAIRLAHLSINYLRVQSNWHVARQAKDVSCVYPYDAELMNKVGEVGCLKAGAVMLARCLSIMQHQRRAAEGRSDLRERVSDLER